MIPRVLEKIMSGHISHLNFIVLLIENNEIKQRHNSILTLYYNVMHHSVIAQ